jgi:hypothetical protein
MDGSNKVSGGFVNLFFVLNFTFGEDIVDACAVLMVCPYLRDSLSDNVGVGGGEAG